MDDLDQFNEHHTTNILIHLYPSLYICFGNLLKPLDDFNSIKTVNQRVKGH